MATSKRAPRTAASAAAPDTREPLVSVSVSAGGAHIACEGVPVSRAAEVLALLNAQLDAALRAQPSLRGQLDHVPGGTIPYVDDGDVEGRRRLGFRRG